MDNIILFIVACATMGIFSGILSGLLGLGGGIIIVPALTILIPKFFSISDSHLFIVCITTSFCVIVFNTGVSFIRQIQNKNISFPTLLKVAPFLVSSSILTSQMVPKINPAYLKIIFAFILIFCATKMLLSKKVQEDNRKPTTENISLLKGAIAGITIGGLSTTAGISGGSFLSPFFTACKLPIKKALGTASACGFFLASSSAIGYLVSGYSVDIGIPYTFGYLSIIAFLSFIATSMYCASLGVKLQQVLPSIKLKRIFAIVLYLFALEMLYKGVIPLITH